MVAINRGIQGNGYYPGARGFQKGTDPTNGVMLLGRDFGLYSYYQRRSSIPNADETMYTWQRTVGCILEPLSTVGVWAVNYLIGARRSGPTTGNLHDLIPEHEWLPYEEYCWGFLARMVLLQHPKYVVVLVRNNETDLRGPERFACSRYTFRSEGKEHSAEILYEPHPSALRSRLVQSRARERYKSLAHSMSNAPSFA